MMSFWITVGRHPGFPLCSRHQCSSCGSDVGELGIHGLTFRFSKGCHSRHAAALNVMIKRVWESAKVPCLLEPIGLSRSDGKRPDRVLLVPWRHMKSVGVGCHLSRHPSPTSLLPCLHRGWCCCCTCWMKKAAETFALYTHHSMPVAAETLGVFSADVCIYQGCFQMHISINQDPLAHGHRYLYRPVQAMATGIYTGPTKPGPTSILLRVAVAIQWNAAVVLHGVNLNQK